MLKEQHQQWYQIHRPGVRLTQSYSNHRVIYRPFGLSLPWCTTMVFSLIKLFYKAVFLSCRPQEKIHLYVAMSSLCCSGSSLKETNGSKIPDSRTRHNIDICNSVHNTPIRKSISGRYHGSCDIYTMRPAGALDSTRATCFKEWTALPPATFFVRRHKFDVLWINM